MSQGQLSRFFPFTSGWSEMTTVVMVWVGMVRWASLPHPASRASASMPPSMYEIFAMDIRLRCGHARMVTATGGRGAYPRA